MASRPSPSYSLTLRVEYSNRLGMLGRITSLIGERGGDIGAIDIVQSTKGAMTRDITFSAANVDHGKQIIEAVRDLGEVDIVQVSDRTFLLHLGGKLEITPKVPVKTRDDISMIYTPGVARIVEKIVENADDAFNLTIKKNTVAVITDGSEVLGMGAAGPQAALPVMEAKAILFKEFAGVDAFPLPLDVETDEEFVAAVRAIAPAFGAIHIEDIAAPRCFRLEKMLTEALDIPVFHNDQHGTAIVALAGLINALKIIGKSAQSLRVVINGAEAAGVATAKLLIAFGVRDIILCDERGILSADQDDETLLEMAQNTNPRKVSGGIVEALVGADALMGFGHRTVLEPSAIEAMNVNPIVFAMANPNPEIEPSRIAEIARVIATGKSDFPNQINNMLCFPGFFRGLLDARATKVNDEMKLAAAHAIAGVIGPEELHEDYLIPSVFNRRVANAVARAVAKAAQDSGAARKALRPSL
ncbi:NAD-dependent malic enzyme [Abditibacterium utsteinense]|nr:NAD-dependent malic enzyme [Abditibacterium utsteinense]